MKGTVVAVKIEYFHASKHGNGAKVIVVGLKGPLEESGQKKVAAFAARVIPTTA